MAVGKSVLHVVVTLSLWRLRGDLDRNLHRRLGSRLLARRPLHLDVAPIVGHELRVDSSQKVRVCSQQGTDRHIHAHNGVKRKAGQGMGRKLLGGRMGSESVLVLLLMLLLVLLMLVLMLLVLLLLMLVVLLLLLLVLLVLLQLRLMRVLVRVLTVGAGLRRHYIVHSLMLRRRLCRVGHLLLMRVQKCVDSGWLDSSRLFKFGGAMSLMGLSMGLGCLHLLLLLLHLLELVLP
jgi:hypothetical protein